MGTTARLVLPYPELTDNADVPEDIRALALALDQAAIVNGGTLANRPTSTAGTPGKLGRLYYATDNGQLYWDTGTAWVSLTPGDGVFQAALAGSLTLAGATGWRALDGGPGWIEDSDLSGWFDSSNGRYTPLIKGIYQFDASAYFGAPITGSDLISAGVYKNGALVNRHTPARAYGASLPEGVSAAVKIAANGTTDYFQMAVYFTTADATLLADATFWGAHLIARQI